MALRDKRSNERGGGKRRGGGRSRDRDDETKRGKKRGRGGSKRGRRNRRSSGRDLSGVGDADVGGSKRGPYLCPGKYLYEIESTDWKETQDGAELLIHNLKILSVYDCRPDPDAADNPDYADPDEPYRVGDTCVFTVNLGQKKTWAGNLKSFIVGIEPDCRDDEIDDFAMSCYPPEIPEFEDLADELLDGDLVLRDEDGDDIEIEDDDHAEEVAEDHLKMLKRWESPIAGMLIYGEMWRNRGKSWVNAKWRQPTDEEIEEIGFDALEDERPKPGRKRRGSKKARRRAEREREEEESEDEEDSEEEESEDEESEEEDRRRKRRGRPSRRSPKRSAKRGRSRRSNDDEDD